MSKKTSRYEKLPREHPATREKQVEPEVEPKPAPVQIPDPPPWLRGVALAVQREYGVPSWVVLLVAWTGSEYATKCPAMNNSSGYLAQGSEKKNETGHAWFVNRKIEYARFGIIASRGGLDWSKPKEAIKKLKPVYPNIENVPYTQFME